VDVYSFGVVILELLLREDPKEYGPNREEQVQRALTKDKRLGRLIQACISSQPEKRPKPTTILSELKSEISGSQEPNVNQRQVVQRENNTTLLKNLPDKGSSLEELTQWYLSQPWTFPFHNNALQVNTRDILGSGVSGVIFGAKLQGEQVAAKSSYNFLYPELSNLDDLQVLRASVELVVSELMYISQFAHPNIARFRGLFWENMKLQKGTFKIPKWIVMDLIKGKNLENFIQQPNNRQFVGIIAKQLIDVLCHIRSKGIVHRNLQPSTIIFDETTNKLTVTGFLCAKFLSKTQKATATGSPLYCAPEIYGNGVYGPSVDVYSFGVILLEFVLFENPTTDVQERKKQIERAITQNPPLGSLIERCLSNNSHDRPHPEEIRQILNQIFPS
jgi:serine/threonine protein kinase